MLYKDDTMTMSDKLLLVVFYLLPIVTVIFVPGLWFVYPILALIFFIRPPKSYVARFHLVQSILCFLIFIVILMLSLTIDSANSHNMTVVTATGIVISTLLYLYFVLILATIVLFIMKRYLRLPLLRILADKYASRVRRA